MTYDHTDALRSPMILPMADEMFESILASQFVQLDGVFRLLADDRPTPTDIEGSNA